jgi:hypothetical protein
MIIAVVAVGMMQRAFNQIIHVPSVRNGWMSAVGAMHMFGRMTCRAVCALVRVRCVHLDHVLIHMVSVGMMEVAFVKIIRVALVLNGSMSATGTMLVGVIRMFRAIAHVNSFRLRSFFSSLAIQTNLPHMGVFRKGSCCRNAILFAVGRFIGQILLQMICNYPHCGRDGPAPSGLLSRGVVRPRLSPHGVTAP